MLCGGLDDRNLSIIFFTNTYYYKVKKGYNHLLINDKTTGLRISLVSLNPILMQYFTK